MLEIMRMFERTLDSYRDVDNMSQSDNTNFKHYIYSWEASNCSVRQEIKWLFSSLKAQSAVH
jgi:hypothetical protein